MAFKLLPNKLTKKIIDEERADAAAADAAAEAEHHDGKKEEVRDEKAKKCCGKIFKKKAKKAKKDDENSKPELGKKSKKADKDNKQKNKDSSEEIKNFPCCFYIPLDIAMEGFALIDIVYNIAFAFLWGVFLALEPFAGKDEDLLKQKSLNNSLDSDIGVINDQLRSMQAREDTFIFIQRPDLTRSRSFLEDDEPLNPSDFWETTTPDPSGENVLDKKNDAREFSRIARNYKEFGQEVDNGCGREYYVKYLFGHQLIVTKELFERVARLIIYGSLLYAVLGSAFLITLCCFRGYIASKVIVIFLWYLQLVPTYLILRAAIMSQSQRLCILQYGVGKTTRGQRIIFWIILWPLLSYKPYEAFIWANYIHKYFTNKEGQLVDESYFSGKRGRRQNKLMSGNISENDNEHEHHRRALDRSKLFRQAPRRPSKDFGIKNKPAHLLPLLAAISRKQDGDAV